MSIQENKSANELALDRTELAASRTLMAADRSLMAWIRTALSMISFGFTLYKVLQAFKESGGGIIGNGVIAQSYNPRNVGLFLIGLGFASIVLGTIEYWHTLKELNQLGDYRVWRPSFVIALIISCGGLFMFVGVLFKLF